MSEGIYDLIYDNEPKAALSAAFPDAQITDASDYIHEDRFSIAVSEKDADRYLKWILREGWVNASLWFGLTLGGRSGNSEDLKRLKRLVVELKDAPAKEPTP